MAKELTISINVAFSKGGITAQMQSGSVQLTVSGTDYVRETWSVPTSVTAIPLGAVATPGYCFVVNRDATNFVDIYPSTGGAATIRVKPGECQLFRFAAAAPAMKADTAPAKVEFLLFAN